MDKEIEYLTRIEKAKKIAFYYGSIDGAHHKSWLIDQMIRTLTGCKGSIETDEYKAWVERFNSDGYEWDKGIAP